MYGTNISSLVDILIFMADTFQMYKSADFNTYTLALATGTATGTQTWTLVEAFASNFPTEFPIIAEVYESDATLYSASREIIIISGNSSPSRQITVSTRAVSPTSVYNHQPGAYVRLLLTATAWNNMIDEIRDAKTLIAARALQSSLDTTNTNVTTNATNISSVTTRVTSLETRTSPTVGTAGTNPANNGTSTQNALLDHEHKIFYEWTPIIQAPSSGANSYYFANKTSLTYEVTGFYVVVNGTVGTTLTTISLRKASQASIDSGTPSYSTITSPNLTIDANEWSSNTAATPVGLTGATIAPGEHVVMTCTTAGTGVGDLSGFVTLKLKNTN